MKTLTAIVTFSLLFSSIINSQTKKEGMKGLIYTTTLDGTYDEVFTKVQTELQKVGFGILSQVAMHDKLKAKLNFDMPIYQILGVCSPKHAQIALAQEENIGLFLPCKVLIKQKGENTFEIVTTNTEQLMGMLGNEGLNEVAAEVNGLLKTFIDNLK